MNICLLGLSGSGKTCYLYTMSHVLANGISINGHTISATSTDRLQQLRLNRGIEQMANGIWPDGSTDTITYSFDLKVDGCSMGEFTIYDYRGGALDGMSDNDMDDAEELFDTFEDSSCITFLIDGDTLLAALDPQYLETEHSNISFQSQLKARHKINYIESLIKECSQRLDNNVPILLVITKKDIFSDNELTAGQELLRNLLPTVFSKHNDMTVGITSVTLGRNLNNDHGKITNRQVTLYLNTKGNIHLPVLFALLQDLDDDINVPIDVEEIRSLTYKLFTPDRISFYRGGRKAVIL